MAINKKLIHFKNFSDFNSKKLSANENNTQYTLGINGSVTNGSPDILYQSICYIKDTKQQWTHGQLYDGTNLNEAGFLAGEETSDQLDDVETNTYVKYVPQTLTNEQKAQTRINIGAVSEDNFKTINGESILGSGDIEISGGGSSGDDNRYFTEFTVEEFIEGCLHGSTITNSITELFNAVDNNKIICVPYNNCELGFLIASCAKVNSETDHFHFYLETCGVQYTAYCTKAYGSWPDELLGSEYKGYAPTIEVETEDGGCYIEMADNFTYYIMDEVNYLTVVQSMYTSLNGTFTVCFRTGDDPSLEIDEYTLWPNGNGPILEPYTNYELSITAPRTHDEGYCHAVITPFKPVE